MNDFSLLVSSHQSCVIIVSLLTDLQQARDNIADDDGNTVPLLMQNKAPVRDDSTKADVELRPDQVRTTVT